MTKSSMPFQHQRTELTYDLPIPPVRLASHGPNRCLYSVEEMNAFTISALI